MPESLNYSINLLFEQYFDILYIYIYYTSFMLIDI